MIAYDKREGLPEKAKPHRIDLARLLAKLDAVIAHNGPMVGRRQARPTLYEAITRPIYTIFCNCSSH